MKILGIDPGIAIVGIGVLQKQGSRLLPLQYGKITTESGISVPERLLKISQDLDIILDALKPDEVAIEKLFFNKNTKTAMTVAEARGAILLTISRRGLPIAEYTPLQVKQSVCGYGGADKNQVQQMVKSMLNLAEVPKPDDTADALAIAICHAHTCVMQKLMMNV